VCRTDPGRAAGRGTPEPTANDRPHEEAAIRSQGATHPCTTQTHGLTDSPMTPRQTRRSVLKAAGAGAVLGSLSLGASAAAEASLDDQLAAVRDATEKYADPQVALEDGYRVLGPFVPGMGWHFISQDAVQSAAQNGLDVERPQVLVYGDTGAGCDGELVLGAVEYAIPVGARGYGEDSPPDIFNDDEGEEHWHVLHAAEHVLAVPDDPGADDFPGSPADVALADQVRTTNWLQVAPGGDPGSPTFQHGQIIAGDLADGATLDARAVVGASVHPDLWTLHAWVHRENPAGVFTDQNHEVPASPAE